MGTHAIIAYQDSVTGKIEGIYCHYDGDSAGEILKEHYKDPEKVKQLIDLGSISYLQPECYLPAFNGKDEHPHSFAHPIEGYTVAYHRDRGDDRIDTEKFKDAKEFFKGKKAGRGIEYLHLFHADTCEWESKPNYYWR
jgi:hypothetical protein